MKEKNMGKGFVTIQTIQSNELNIRWIRYHGWYKNNKKEGLGELIEADGTR